MPKNTNVKNDPPLATAGVTTVLGGTRAPSIVVGGTHAGSVQCDCCGLFLPRSATHPDVLGHPCYRGFTIAITAAGQISLS